MRIGSFASLDFWFLLTNQDEPLELDRRTVGRAR
jgi:hypothetical protein